MTSWDEALDVGGPDDGHDGQGESHRGLGDAVVSSMFDLVGTGDSNAGEDEMDDAFLQEAILEHAKFLGMDPEHDRAFLWIAEEALTAPLPDGWQQANAEDGTPYHFNPDTGESLWEHPLDDVYRQKFRDEKAKAQAEEAKAIAEAQARAAEQEAQQAARAERQRREQKEKEEAAGAIAAKNIKKREEEEKKRREDESERREREDRERQVQRKLHQHEISNINSNKDGCSGSGDWFDEIREMSTLGNGGNAAAASGKHEMETLIEEFDMDDSITYPDSSNTKHSHSSSSAVSGSSSSSTSGLPTTTAITAAVAEAKVASDKQLREKDAKISDLRKQLANQRKEYEEILAEQRDILRENESAMNELTELHNQEITEMTAQISRTREASAAASEAHTVDTEKLQQELDRAREQTITAEENAAAATTAVEKKEAALANAQSENTVLESKLSAAAAENLALEQRLEHLEQDLKAARAKSGECTKEINAVKEQLRLSQTSEEALSRAKSALADEIRKLVTEKDGMISKMEDLRTELADARREVSKVQATAKSEASSAASQRERDAELHKQALLQQKNHEATRLSELRRSFDERCRALVNEKSEISERFEEKIGTLTAQLEDVRARAAAVVADAENASQETSVKLAQMQDTSEKSRRRAEAAEAAVNVLQIGKEDDARERKLLQARIDDLQTKTRALETELNKSRQQEEISELKRKLAAVSERADEVLVCSGCF